MIERSITRSGSPGNCPYCHRNAVLNQSDPEIDLESCGPTASATGSLHGQEPLICQYSPLFGSKKRWSPSGRLKIHLAIGADLGGIDHGGQDIAELIVEIMRDQARQAYGRVPGRRPATEW